MPGRSPGAVQAAHGAGAAQRRCHHRRHARALRQRDLLAALDSLHQHFDYNAGNKPACGWHSRDYGRTSWMHCLCTVSAPALRIVAMHKRGSISKCRRPRERGAGRGRLVRRLPECAAQPGGHARALRAHHAGAHRPERDGALMPHPCVKFEKVATQMGSQASQHWSTLCRRYCIAGHSGSPLCGPQSLSVYTH